MFVVLGADFFSAAKFSLYYQPFIPTPLPPHPDI